MKKALVVGTALGVASSADAAVFNVTTNADNGAGSLRQAIADANAAAGPDAITFDASLSGSTITLTSGEMLISDSVDIQGPGAAGLTVDANEASRVFYVYNPSPVPVDVTISGLTLANGFSSVPGDPPASAGGAIRSIGENLTLDGMRVENSIAAGAGGGVAFFAIDAMSSYEPVSAVLSIQGSVITGNTANLVDLAVPVDQGGCGGGVAAYGIYNVQVADTTLSNNGARCDGGGLAALVFQDGGEITIERSTITGNTAGLGESGNGGGLAFVGYNFGYDPTPATVIDSTISGNTAAGGGGGVSFSYLYGGSLQRTTVSGNDAGYAGGVAVTYAVAALENTTVAQNHATQYGGGAYVYSGYLAVKETTVSGNTADADGPGIYAYSESLVSVVDSIVANNEDADLLSDESSSFDVAYSLVENVDPTLINDAGGNIFDTDPQLGSLQDNGGPTLTMKPASTSPAIDAGDPAFAPPPATDQRGFARVAGGRIDMGAVELNAGTLQFSIAAQDVNENAGVATVTVTRTGGIDGPASAQVAVGGASTATGGGDYTFAGTTVTFPDNGDTPQSFNVTIVDDTADEPAETIALQLTGLAGTAIGVPASHTITIIDDDVALPASADLSVAKVLEPGPLTQGSNATFTITVSNAGPDAATDVVVTDVLPPQLTFVSATPSAGTCDNGPVTVTCNLGTLNASGSATITLVATLSGTGAATNTAAVASGTADGDGTDNTDQVTFTISLPASVPAVPALDARMQLLLAAIIAAAAMGILKRH